MRLAAVTSPALNLRTGDKTRPPEQLPLFTDQDVVEFRPQGPSPIPKPLNQVATPHRNPVVKGPDWGSKLLGLAAVTGVGYTGLSLLMPSQWGNSPLDHLVEMPMKLARMVTESTESVGLGIATGVACIGLAGGVAGWGLLKAGNVLDRLTAGA